MGGSPAIAALADVTVVADSTSFRGAVGGGSGSLGAAVQLAVRSAFLCTKVRAGRSTPVVVLLVVVCFVFCGFLERF